MATYPLFPTIGDFNVFWDSSNVSPADVATLKQEHPNVKVALNLGSDSVVGNPVYFNPISVDSSVANAVSSLTTIIQDYHLCGPDAYYEHFKADLTTFSDCIGKLIYKLKRNRVTSFASIAPFDNSNVLSHYQALWTDYRAAINYVNLQFYACDSEMLVVQLLDHYEA
ncbi:hypothetical protein HPP92_026603 [Vanilla planifolia]|uniref:GH18 domain-containing protein n=1 Tax=Vanilla planifolia TaxID=51239 RepID=A0A835PF70_VANPL|nr:hypothetical protein HPP92_026603 [Vanilla planifolia]